MPGRYSAKRCRFRSAIRGQHNWSVHCLCPKRWFQACHRAGCSDRVPGQRRRSQTAQTAYHDLVSFLLDDDVTDPRGTPTARQINGKTYWYDRYRIGGDIHEKYLGEVTPDLLDRLSRFEALKEERAGRRHERARLVRLLRSEKFLGLDSATGSLVNAVAKSSAFKLGDVFVGTVASPLNYLLAEPLQAAAVNCEGILVRIPRPERFAIHKLIVSDRRKEGPESTKRSSTSRTLNRSPRRRPPY